MAHASRAASRVRQGEGSNEYRASEEESFITKAREAGPRRKDWLGGGGGAVHRGPNASGKLSHGAAMRGS